MDTPQINVVRNRDAFRANIQDAHAGRLGDPLAWGFDMATWGSGNAQAQHIIPFSVANSDSIRSLFGTLRTATMGAAGGPFVFDINDAQNGVFLPTSDTAAQAAHARDESINAAGQLVLIRCGAWITWNCCWPASTIRTRRAYAG